MLWRACPAQEMTIVKLYADYLQKKYDWPRLIYQVHVQANSRELQHLHDTENQHYEH